MDKFELMISAVENWLIDRPTMDENNTPQVLLSLLMGEVEELLEAQTIYSSKPTEMSKKELEQEVADVAIFFIQYTLKMNISLLEEIAEKIAYNYIRYPACMWQEGDYEETRIQAKLRSNLLGLKDEFYGENY